MPAAEPQLDRIQSHLQARFQKMGLATRPMRDGRSLLVSMDLGAAPFETLDGATTFGRIIFSTVGPDRIKCLRPRALFDLPLLNVQDCKNSVAIESVIRRAWRERIRKLQDTTRWLSGIGIEPTPTPSGTSLSFPLPGESPDARILMQDRRTAILPSAGPLRGLTLDSPAERLISVSDQIDASADLECLFAARIDSHRRRARKQETVDRARSLQQTEVETDLPRIQLVQPIGPLPRKVLIVGSQLVTNAELRDELQRQGFRIATARSEPEALLRLASMSPDLVLSEYALGRSDGATLVQTTLALPGIEGIPVVLIDTEAHPRRREAARAVGAAGYVILNLKEIGRFVRRVIRLLDERKGRRFTRYAGRFQARLHGLDSSCLATEVGRGGVFIATEAEAELHSSAQCLIALPELGRNLQFEAQVLYRAQTQGTLPGLGLRFHEISPTDEATLIEYLEWLENHA